MKYAGMHNQVFNQVVITVPGTGATKTVLQPQGGQAGDLTAQEVADIIKRRAATRVISNRAALECANFILDHKGGDSAGEALGGIQWNGHAIYHKTRNKPTVAQGCSVFFCDPGTGYAKIVAVANHIGARPETYRLDWVASDFKQDGWKAGRSITL